MLALDVITFKAMWKFDPAEFSTLLDGQTAEQRMGARDSMVADLLQQEQLEESGRIQRKLASR